MVVNKSKMELMFMKNKKAEIPKEITAITVQNKMKILGIQFDNDLSLTSQADTLVKHSYKMISRLRVLRRSLSRDDIMKVITS